MSPVSDRTNGDGASGGRSSEKGQSMDSAPSKAEEGRVPMTSQSRPLLSGDELTIKLSRYQCLQLRGADDVERLLLRLDHLIDAAKWLVDERSDAHAEEVLEALDYISGDAVDEPPVLAMYEDELAQQVRNASAVEDDSEEDAGESEDDDGSS